MTERMFLRRLERFYVIPNAVRDLPTLAPSHIQEVPHFVRDDVARSRKTMILEQSEYHSSLNLLSSWGYTSTLQKQAALDNDLNWLLLFYIQAPWHSHQGW